MSTTITKRQQHWLKHIRAADSFDGSIAAYARSHGLKAKELYQWKTRLKQEGRLDADSSAKNALVRVVTPPQRLHVALVLPGGARLEFDGELSESQLRSIVSAAHGLS